MTPTQQQQFNSGLGMDVVFPTPGQIMRRRMMTHKGFIIGGVMVLMVFMVAIFAPYLSSHDPYHQNLSNRMVPPVWSEAGSWDHPLGTDSMGRDYLSRLVYGSRVSILIGFSCMSIAAVIGISLGLTAGYFGGKADYIVSFIITVRLALPAVLVAIA
ncbi:MAG: ABC transporter permease, partial [Deltaproteobacteria bacterium]